MSRPLTEAVPMDGAAASALEEAVLQSIAYAAVFDYPLTLTQLRSTLVGVAASESDVEACCRTSTFLRERIAEHDGYYFPKGRQHTVVERRAREVASRETLLRHRRLLRALCSVPYTRLVALSGSLAHLNGVASADLDLFVVTSARRVWSVTVVMVVLAKLWGQRRVVCVNYVVSERQLVVRQQDLFAASQILHLKPLVGADVYARFLDANPFVDRCYPNAVDARAAADADHWGAAPLLEWARPRGVGRFVKRSLELAGHLGPAHILELLCRIAYGRYLRRQSASWRSPEQVQLEPECLKLHTQSHRRRVLTTYARTIDSQ